jgi:hypothetical protein
VGPILAQYILILSQLIFIFTALFCVINGEAANTNYTYLFRMRLQSEINFSVTINVEVRGN